MGLIGVGNSGIQTILPALGRTSGMQDWMVAAVFSLSAVIWGLLSSHWAVLSDRVGRKRMICLGLGGLVLSMLLSCLVALLALAKLVSPTMIFILLLVSRATAYSVPPQFQQPRPMPLTAPTAPTEPARSWRWPAPLVSA